MFAVVISKTSVIFYNTWQTCSTKRKTVVLGQFEITQHRILIPYQDMFSSRFRSRCTATLLSRYNANRLMT